MHLRTTILPMVRNIRHPLFCQWTRSRHSLHCQALRAALLPGPWHACFCTL